MADVFISYSRDDRPRVALIATALEAEGLSVWWDPEILPGTTFDEVIDRELEAASCVIVAWSEKSRQSRWVREEANDGLTQEILIPVLIEAVPLPRGFKLVQTEDLVQWQGDRNADAWQRIMLQARALVGKPEIAQREAPTPTNATSVAVATAATSPPTTTIDATTSLSTGILTVLAVLILAGTWFYGTQQKSPVIAGAVVLAALAFVLFRFAESDLSPALKSIASRWFLPVHGRVRVSSIEAFNGMFEAVFGRQHLTRKCFLRSSLASVGLVVLFSTLLDYYTYEKELFRDFTRFAPIYLSFVLTINIIGDYISLFETRIMLQFIRLKKIPMHLGVVVDAILTILIFCSMFIISASFLMIVDIGGLGQKDLATGVGSLIKGVFIIVGSGSNEDGIATFFLTAFATTFVTSAWLWLALICTPIVRFFVWSRRTGLTTFGRIFDAERKPFTALGYVTALLILIIGGSIWGVTKAMAAFG